VGPIAICWIMFACIFGGALLGMFLRAALPEQHQGMESKDVLKLMSPILEKRSKTLRKVKSFT
jgi:hypothetical protein